MNTEERQLAEMLHRVTPEPPRRVTVDDVAFRVASEHQREPRLRRSFWRGVVREGAAGRRFWPRSACSPSPGPARGSRPWRPRTAARPRPRRAPASQSPPRGRCRQRNGWPADVGARLINHQLFSQGSLTSGGDSLFAVGGGHLDRIDPHTGAIVRSTPNSPAVVQPAGGYREHGVGGVVLRRRPDRPARLRRRDARPGRVGAGARHRRRINQAQGVLAAGPGGQLYLAAGDTWPPWTRPPAG